MPEFLIRSLDASTIFLIAGLPDEEMGPMMGIFCPNILFPYAREVVTDLVARGSFPQLVLAPVNFELIYKNRLAEAATAQQQAGN